MKHLIALLVLASLAIVGCTDKNAQEPVSAQLSVMPFPLNKPTPFKMTFAVGSSLNFTGRCQPAPTQELTGTGNATQLGRFTIVESHCLGAPNPDGTIDVYNGVATTTAANGDLLYQTYSGKVTPLGGPIYRIDALSIITGGTGRIANARGEQVATGVLKVKVRPDRVEALSPLYADAFDSPLGVMIFRRDAGRRVTAFSAVQDRAWDVRFERAAPPSPAGK